MTPTVKCTCCAKDMELEVRVPRLGTLGEFHYFFSCECGHVTSQVCTENVTSQALNENLEIEDEKFLSWATRKRASSELPDGRWGQKIRARVEAGS
jgi:hypothetical protein